jgi:hypothetical protein
MSFGLPAHGCMLALASLSHMAACTLCMETCAPRHAVNGPLRGNVAISTK